METLLANDQPAPVFTLPALNGALYSLDNWLGKVVILNFWSVECPWSKRADQEMLAYLSEWGESVALCAIASNANESSAELLEHAAAERGLPVVLVDAQQQAAYLYGAQTTPHLFVVDHGGILRYQGGLDDVTFRQRTPTHAYLRRAVEAVLAGKPPDPAITSPYGCAIVRFQI